MVKHSMTIRTYRDKIGCWIDNIRRSYFSNRFNVMNMDKSLTHCSIYFTEIKSTYYTFATISIYALASCFSATFITVDYNSRFSAFRNFVIWICQFIRIIINKLSNNNAIFKSERL